MRIEMKGLEEPFKLLEDQVRRTAETVRALRRENQTLKRALADAQAQRAREADGSREVVQLRKNQARLEKELATFQSEKNELCTRVEGLLRELDSLNLD
jgi:predicted  nucleic acid-binding Zn-ribbon protein